MSAIAVKSTTKCEDFEVSVTKTKEIFDIEDNESVGHPQVPKKKDDSPEVTWSLNKCDKLLGAVVTVMAAILIVTSAMVAAAYVESIKMKKEIEVLQEILAQVMSENENATKRISEMELKLSTVGYGYLKTESAYQNSTDILLSSLKQCTASYNTLSNSIHQFSQSHFMLETKTEQLENKSKQLETKTELLETKTQQLRNCLVGQCPITSGHSCAAILQVTSYAPPGYYWVRSSSGSAVRVYCDMTKSCGGITGGWMRVAHFNMRNTGTQCPKGFSVQVNSSIRTCIQSTTAAGCSFVNYQTNGVMHSHICGTIRAYQIGTTDGFEKYGIVRPGNPTVDSNYIDGVSLTHGMNPRQHIWSFAAGGCPCFNDKPLFVSDDFSCDGETGQCVNFCGLVLWDGNGCQSNNKQGFHKQMPQSSTDDIEMRLCRDEDRNNEDIAIEIVEILIQ